VELAANADGSELERDAATALGYIVFEFARLEMELGLFSVWSDEGRKLDDLTRKLNDGNFINRLEFLERLAESKYSNTSAGDEYAKWFHDAHLMRSLRNRFFHGRWAFLPQQKMVANVVGLPTSEEQAESRYSIAELRQSFQMIRALRNRLGELRQKWPV
jgi:hypothetical protein